MSDQKIFQKHSKQQYTGLYNTDPIDCDLYPNTLVKQTCTKSQHVKKFTYLAIFLFYDRSLSTEIPKKF